MKQRETKEKQHLIRSQVQKLNKNVFYEVQKKLKKQLTCHAAHNDHRPNWLIN